MLPGSAKIPPIVPGVAFGSVFAVLVDHGRAADDGFEAVRFSFYEARHFPAVAVAFQCEPVGIDVLGLEDMVEPGHDVCVVASAEVILVGGGECRTVVGASSWIGAQNGPALANQEIDPDRVVIHVSAQGTTVHLYDQRNFGVLYLRGKAEKPLQVLRAIFPVEPLGRRALEIRGQKGWEGEDAGRLVKAR